MALSRKQKTYVGGVARVAGLDEARDLDGVGRGLAPSTRDADLGAGDVELYRANGEND